MKKIVIFWEDRFGENFNGYKENIDMRPYLELIKINGKDNTITYDMLDKKSNKEEYIILCFLTFGIFNFLKYFKLFLYNKKNTKYFFIFEPYVVSPLNYSKVLHYFFNRIYSWNDQIIDNKRYYKFFYPSTKKIGKIIKFKDKKFLTLINGNKYSFIKNELYFEREKIIRYLESTNIEFDLYGTNWNKPNLRQKLFGYKKYPSYKGRVKDKIETISNYKFNICFENMKDTPGYITEKIWDSFMAHSIPVYWGASNISEYVPENCFIDFRNYENNYEKLILFLESIDEKMYEVYVENINQFMKTEEAQKWFDKKWAYNFLNSL